MKHFSLLLIGSLLLAPELTHARPSQRSILENIETQEKTRQQQIQRNILDGLGTNWKNTTIELNGWNFSYPEDWNYTITVYDEKDANPKNQIRISTDKYPSNPVMSITGYESLVREPSIEQLRGSFDHITTAPETDFENINKDYIREYKLISQEETEFWNLPAFVNVFGYQKSSRNRIFKSIQAIDGRIIYSFSYYVDSYDYDKFLPIFETFIDRLFFTKEQVQPEYEVPERFKSRYQEAEEPVQTTTDEVVSENMKSRTCSRVFKRFSDNEKMITRVNIRLIKRFGFECT